MALRREVRVSPKVAKLVLAIIFALAGLNTAHAQTFVSTILDIPEADIAAREVSASDLGALLTALEGNPELYSKLSEGTRRVAGEVQTRTKQPTDLTELQRQEIAATINRSRLDALNTLPEGIRETVRFLANCADMKDQLVNVPLPTRWNPERTECFWNQDGLEVLKSGQVVGNQDHATAAVELLADTFWGIRVDVKTSVSSGGDEDEAAADDQSARRVQQLITSGGNLSLTARYPWYLYASEGQRVNAYVTSFGRIGTIIPAFGESGTTGASPSLDLAEANGNFELALIDAQGELRSHGGNITVVAFLKASGVNGTKKFHEAIGHSRRQPFWYAQYGLGVKLAKYLYLMASFSQYGDDSIPRPGGALTIGLGR